MKDKNMLLGPPPVVTIIPTSPAARADGVQVIVVSLTTLILVASILPIVTVVAPVKFMPVIVTLVVTIVPPSVLPDDGEILLIKGGVI